MDSFKNLQNVWQQQDDADLPSIDTLKKDIRKISGQLLRKNVLAIAALLLTIGVMVLLFYTIDFKFLSTKIAIVGMILIISLAILFMARIVNQMYQADRLQYTSKDYLSSLKTFKIKQNSWQQKVMVGYFLAITALMYLYLFEIYQMSSSIGIVAYISVSLWGIYVWGVMRPKRVKQQEKRINTIIANVEAIEQQLISDK